MRLISSQEVHSTIQVWPSLFCTTKIASHISALLLPSLFSVHLLQNDQRDLSRTWKRPMTYIHTRLPMTCSSASALVASDSPPTPLFPPNCWIPAVLLSQPLSSQGPCPAWSSCTRQASSSSHNWPAWSSSLLPPPPQVSAGMPFPRDIALNTQIRVASSSPQSLPILGPCFISSLHQLSKMIFATLYIFHTQTLPVPK